MRYEAYWIDPEGAVIPVEQTHIKKVIDMCERFGVTIRNITDAFAETNEPLGHEGSARNIIMLELIKKGWIRLRFEKRPTGWKVQCWHLDKKTLKSLLSWASGMIDGTYDNVSRHTEILINELSISDKTWERVSLEKILNQSFESFKSRKREK